MTWTIVLGGLLLIVVCSALSLLIATRLQKK
jgi:hypothetical protein